MTRDEIERVFTRALLDIAPDADTSSLDPEASLRDELDIDSMDLLALARRLHEALGVTIPERDYVHIDSLRGAVDYLAAALSARG
ncbi:MAG: hypothetical protein SangKO_053510 [Sandaracinaceae bacterium]|nr:MAG: acyl carrier protein [Sandaracinaceae bacterium]